MAKKQKQQEDKQDNEAVRNENAKPDGGKVDATEANNNNEETTKMKKREKRPKRQRQPKEEEKADEAFEIEDEELTKVMNGAIGGDKTDSDDDDDDSLHMSQDEFDEADLDKKDKRKQKKRRLDEQEIEEQETDAPTTDDANDTTKQNPFALGKSFGTILAKILDEQVGGSTPVLAKFNVKESLIMKEKELRRQENAKRIISLAVKEKGLVKPDFTTLNFERQLAKIARLGVVKLFNAVTKAKLALRAQQNAAAESSSDEDEDIENMDKNSFLDVLRKGDGGAANKYEDEEFEGMGSNKKKWEALDDDLLHFDEADDEELIGKKREQKQLQKKMKSEARK